MSDDDEIESVSVVCYDDGNDDRRYRDGTCEHGVKRFCGVVARIMVVVGCLRGCLRGCYSIGIVGYGVSSSDCRLGEGGPERSQ